MLHCSRAAWPGPIYPCTDRSPPASLLGWGQESGRPAQVCGKPENKRGRAETVRPKSREETPKEGSETSDQSHRPRPTYVDVRRTNYKGFFALQKSGMGMALLPAQTSHGERECRKRRGRSVTNGPSLGRKRPRWATTHRRCAADPDMGLFVVQCNWTTRCTMHFNKYVAESSLHA
jgi:hypothetical protein